MVRRTLPLGGAAFLVLALGCGQPRPASGARTAASGEVAMCTRCHGDPSRAPAADPLAAAAPPRSVRGGEEPGDAGVGAHQLHLADGPWWKAVRCTSCHRVPTDGVAHAPQEQRSRVTFSGLATASWAGAPDIHPKWNGVSCSATYCHGAFPGGDAANAPAWTAARADACGTCHALPPAAPHPAVASDLDTCRRCHPDPLAGTHVNGQVDFVKHDASFVDVASPGFHAALANGGIANCQYCHGADLSGGFTGVACASCHDGGVHGGVTVVAFQVGGATSCVACHGGTDSQTGAPPRATWGHADDAVRVGAHSTHVAGGYDCDICHLNPSDIFSPGHIDGSPAEVVFGGIALTGPSAPSWDRGTARCSATYCHGSTLSGGSNPAPDWTRRGQGEAGCGTCHGLPPAALPSASHPVYVFAAPCLGCHPATAAQDAGGRDALVAGGPHIDGAVQFTFAGHPAGWAVPGFGGFVGGLHSNQACLGCGYILGAFTMGDYYTCTTCHGASGDFEPTGGSVRVSCGACHPAFFDPDGKTSCTFCH